MGWQSLVNDASRALAAWPRATATDVAASLGALGLTVILGCLLVPVAQVCMPPTQVYLGVLPLVLALLAVAVGTGVSAASRAVALVRSLPG